MHSNHEFTDLDEFERLNQQKQIKNIAKFVAAVESYAINVDDVCTNIDIGTNVRMDDYEASCKDEELTQLASYYELQ